MKRDKGFTLIELLVVIAIVGITAALAVPSMSGFVRKNRVHNQTRRLFNDVTNMRVMAMNTNTPHLMTGFPGNQYQVVADNNGNGIIEGTDPVKLVRTAVAPFTFSNQGLQREAMVIEAGAFVNDLVRFDSRGLATFAPGRSQGAVCVPLASPTPNVNCVVVELTRARMGRYTGVCSAANCN